MEILIVDGILNLRPYIMISCMISTNYKTCLFGPYFEAINIFVHFWTTNISMAMMGPFYMVYMPD